MVNKVKIETQVGIVPVILLSFCGLLAEITAYAAVVTPAAPVSEPYRSSTLSSGLQDPTRPADPMTGTLNPGNNQGLALTAIFSAKNRKIAVINGQILRIGEAIQAYTVERIERTQVILRDRVGGVRVLSLTQKPLQVRMMRRTSSAREA